MSDPNQTEALSVSGTQAIVTETDVEQVGAGSLTPGSTIGSSTSYLSMYGVAPVAQAATIAALATTGAISTVALVLPTINAISAVMRNIGLVAQS